MTADKHHPAPDTGGDSVHHHHRHAHHDVPQGIKSAGHDAYDPKGTNVASLGESHHEHHGRKKRDGHQITADKPLTGLDDPRIEKATAAPRAAAGADAVAAKATESPRAKSEVEKVEVRLGHKEGDKTPNYVIDKHGHITEHRSPDVKANVADKSVTIEVDADTKLTKEQQAALDGLTGAVKSEYAGTRDKAVQVTSEMQDVLDRTAAGPSLPDVKPEHRGGGVGSPDGPKDWGSHAGNRGGNGGRVPSAAEARARGDEAPFSADVDWNKLPHGLDRNNQTDRIAALISSNEGKPTSINWNDNGAGVSVGMFQANQRKGELPKLFADFANTPEGFDVLCQIFGPEMAAKIKANPEMIRKLNFNPHNELGKGLMQLVQNPAFQQLQLDQVREKIQEAAPTAQQHGVTSEAGVALVADLINQFGAGGANRFLSAADGVQGQEEKARAIAHAVRAGSKYGGRYIADMAKMDSAGLSFDKTYNA